MATATTYDAFMSYSHSTDRDLAPELQRMLRRVGRPWFRRSTLRIFRDSTSLTMTEDLWHTIEHGLVSSRFFVLMASPAAAGSHWVQREVEHWRRHREPATFFIILTEGTIAWDRDAVDFDWSRTTALPRSLSGFFRSEPLWENLTSFTGKVRKGQQNLQLRDAARTLAAPMYGISKEALDGEDERESRRARRFLQAALAGLTALTLATAVAASVAVVQRNAAVAQLRSATSRALAAESDNLAGRDPVLAARLALLAQSVESSAQTRAAVMHAAERNRHVLGYLEQAVASRDGHDLVTGRGAAGQVVISPDGRTAAVNSPDDGQTRLYDTGSRTLLGTVNASYGRSGNIPPDMRFTPDGHLAVAFGNDIDVWDARTLASVATLSSSDPAASKIFPATDLESELPEYARAYHAVTPDGRLGAVLRENAALEIWRPGFSTPVASEALPGDPGWVTVAVSADGSSVLVGSDSGEVLLFRGSLNTPVSLGTLPVGLNHLSMSEDGSRALAVDVTGTVALLDPLVDRRFDVITNPGGATGSVDDPNPVRLISSPDGRWLAVEAVEELRLWDVDQRRLAGRFPLAAVSGASRAEFSNDGSRLATVESGRVVVRDLASLQELGAEPADGPRAVARALHNTVGGVRFATVYGAEQTEIWMVSSDERVVAAAPESDTGRSVSIVTDGSGAVVTDATASTATDRGQRRMTAFDLRGTEPVEVGTATVPGSADPLSVSADGRHVVLENAVLDMTTGAQVGLAGGEGSYAEVGGVIAGADGLVVRQTGPTRYATGSIRNNLLVWDTREGRLLAEWPEPMPMSLPGDQSVQMVRVGDGRVATVRPDGSVAIWTIDPATWVSGLCASVGEVDEQQGAQYLGDVEAHPVC